MKISTARRIIKAKRTARNIGRVSIKAKEQVGRGIQKTAQATKTELNRIKKESKAVSEKTAVWVNTVLATEFVKGIEQWFTRFNINKDLYDSAVDSVYNQTHIGGSLYHHIYDGQHTLIGAWKAAVNAVPDDSHFRAIVEGTEHLVRDVCSKSGINPFFGITKGQHETLAALTHIPKSWLGDMLTFNAAELLGASIASLALIFGWSRLESKQFSEYAGALGISAIISANPLLGLIVIISAARSFALTKQANTFKDEKHALLKSALKGTVTPSVAIAVSVIIGGPVYVGLILGIITAVLVRKKMDDEKFKQKIRAFLKGYFLDFIKPKARFIGTAVRDAYIKSYSRVKRIKLPRVSVHFR